MNTRKNIDWQSVKSRLQESQASLAASLVAVAGDKLEQVYLQRARQFATRSAAPGKQSDTSRVLTFTVGTERLGIELAAAAEILPYAKCSPIPGADPQLLGVINVRGRICSVLDLARILELPDAAASDRGYIVLVRHEGVQVGLKVDQVDQVEMVSSETSNNLDCDANGRGARQVSGQNGQRATLLNVEAIVGRAGVKHLANPISTARTASR